MQRCPGWRGRWAALAALTGVVAGAGTCAAALYLYVRPAYYVPSSVGVVPPAEGATPIATTPVIPNISAPLPEVGAVPNGLRMPALGITAPVIPEGLVTTPDGPDGPVGSLQIPGNPHTLGWWQDGAAPGSSGGTVVVAGHVDTAAAGAGALFNLGSARPGQTLTLTTAIGSVTYRVVARRSYPKAVLPKSLFSRTGQSRLALVTCGGSFDWATHHYADNVVVYALPVRVG